MKKTTRIAAILLLLALTGCAGILAAVGPAACGFLKAIVGPGGEFWGTACSGIVEAIAEEIKADTSAPAAETRMRSTTGRDGCNKLVPVPRGAATPTAWVCPGFEAAAERAILRQPTTSPR